LTSLRPYSANTTRTVENVLNETQKALLPAPRPLPFLTSVSALKEVNVMGSPKVEVFPMSLTVEDSDLVSKDTFLLRKIE